MEGGGSPDDEVLIIGCGHGVTKEALREFAEAEARKRGYRPPFVFDIWEGAGAGENENQPCVICTKAELGALIEEIRDADGNIVDDPRREEIMADRQ